MSQMPPGTPDMTRVGALYGKYGLEVVAPLLAWATELVVVVTLRPSSASGRRCARDQGARRTSRTDAAPTAIPTAARASRNPLTGARVPVLPQRVLQLSIVHDSVHHGRQPGACKRGSQCDIRPVRAVDDLGVGHDRQRIPPRSRPARYATMRQARRARAAYGELRRSPTQRTRGPTDRVQCRAGVTARHTSHYRRRRRRRARSPCSPLRVSPAPDSGVRATAFAASRTMSVRRSRTRREPTTTLS